LKRLNIAKEKLNSIFMAVMPGWGKWDEYQVHCIQA
jgi:hypothetical protein